MNALERELALLSVVERQPGVGLLLWMREAEAWLWSSPEDWAEAKKKRERRERARRARCCWSHS